MSLASLSTLFFPFSKPHNSVPPFSSSQTKKRCRRVITSVAEDRETVPVVSKDINVLHKDDNTQVSPNNTDDDILTSRAINATIVLGFGAFAVTKLLTIDHDYWHVSIFNFIFKLLFFFHFWAKWLTSFF
jgi:protein Mpv17